MLLILGSECYFCSPTLWVVSEEQCVAGVAGSPFMLSIGGKPSGRVRESVTRQIQAAETVVAGQPSLLQLKLPGTTSFLYKPDIVFFCYTFYHSSSLHFQFIDMLHSRCLICCQVQLETKWRNWREIKLVWSMNCILVCLKHGGLRYLFNNVHSSQ